MEAYALTFEPATPAESIGAGWKPGVVKVIQAGPEWVEHPGWTKSAFGVFQTFMEAEAGTLAVYSLTHLGTGRRIALFDRPATAALAGDLAERVGRWSLLTWFFKNVA